MSSYSTLYIDRREVASFRAPVDPTMLLLFTRNDKRVRRYTATEKPYYGEDDDGLVTCHELVANPSTLRDRLDVLGISRSAVAAFFDQEVGDRLRRNAVLSASIDAASIDPVEVKALLNVESHALAGLTFHHWAEQVSKAPIEPADGLEHRAEPGTWRWLVSFWDDADPRYVVRAFIEAMHNAHEVVLDVTELIGGGWFDEGVDPREAALEHFTWAASNGASVIILPEGRNDADVLDLAIRVLRPHLAGFLRVARFDMPRDGGAGSLVSTIRTLAAAGIANRVVALFDNDTAAIDALSTLDRRSVPANIRVLTLPAIEFASAYPTIGPTGLTTTDINGLAASIEVYLGSDVLTDPKTGQLRPVQWTGYNKKMKRYQGEVLEKSDVLDAFRTKAEKVLADPSLMSAKEWSNIEAVLFHILAALSDHSE
jgi:hypothetical protein